MRTGNYNATVSTSDRVIRSTFSGLRLGLLLALASIGLSLIYGTTGLSNFAHAEQVTMGGMLGFLVVNQWGVNVWLGCVLVVLVCCGSPGTSRTASSGNHCGAEDSGWPR